MRAIAIDFETANERRESACSVGLAWIEEGEVVRRAYRLIRPPEMRFSPDNIRIHGIRPGDVEHAPDLPTAMADFLPDLGRELIIAHNAAFDIGVLRAGLAAHGRPVPRLRYLCTVRIAEKAWPGEPSYRLSAMARKIGHAFSHHHAEDDAVACAKVAIAAAERHGLRRIGDLAMRLGLETRIVSGPPAPQAVRDPPRIVIPSTPEPRPGRLAFTMRGSTGSRYEVEGGFTRAGGYELRCSCMAGLNRRRCRHVTALLDGEIDDLLSDNTFDLEKLRAIVLSLGDEAILPLLRRSAA